MIPRLRARWRHPPGDDLVGQHRKAVDIGTRRDPTVATLFVELRRAVARHHPGRRRRLVQRGQEPHPIEGDFAALFQKQNHLARQPRQRITKGVHPRHRQRHRPEPAEQQQRLYLVCLRRPTRAERLSTLLTEDQQIVLAVTRRSDRHHHHIPQLLLKQPRRGPPLGNTLLHPIALALGIQTEPDPSTRLLQQSLRQLHRERRKGRALLRPNRHRRLLGRLDRREAGSDMNRRSLFEQVIETGQARARDAL